MNQTFELTIRKPFAGGADSKTVIGNWEQVNHWKRLHDRWQIDRVQNGERVMLAQSITYNDACVWTEMMMA